MLLLVIWAVWKLCEVWTHEVKTFKTTNLRFRTHTHIKRRESHGFFSVVNAAVGGSFVLSLPFLLSLWSLGVILNFRLGAEPAL